MEQLRLHLRVPCICCARSKCNIFLSLLCGCIALSYVQPTLAGVLGEDRADALFHRYQGGGVTVEGPSILVRKKFGEKFATNLNYYTDMVSSASIDVVTTASPYTEKRKQKSISAEYLNGKATYSANYINSKESDYEADTIGLSVSEDMFGDLTTVTLGFGRGWDTIGKNLKDATNHTIITDPNFVPRSTDHRNYRLGLSQIITKRLVMSLNYESVSDEGFLNSPYRQVRYCDTSQCTNTSAQEEIYPRTHTSSAYAVFGRYYLPYRAALTAGYRYYTDSWGIHAHTGELGYIHPLKRSWTVETKLRFYSQNHADFYADLFPHVDAKNFLARDKELSTFSNQTIHLGVTYELPFNPRRWLQRSTVNVFYDRIAFQYDDFHDASSDLPPLEQPLYKFDANVYEFFISAWF